MAYKISTSRLILYPLGPEHISDVYVNWLKNNDLMTYSQNRGMKHSLSSCSAYARKFDHKTCWLWAIHTLKGQHIGNTNAYLNSQHNTADIGLLIGDCSGNGYGQEAWEGVMETLFSQIGVRKVTGGCVRQNEKMKRIMVKAEMLPDKERLGNITLLEEAMDLVFFAQFKENYKSRSDIQCINHTAPFWGDI